MSPVAIWAASGLQATHSTQDLCPCRSAFFLSSPCGNLCCIRALCHACFVSLHLGTCLMSLLCMPCQHHEELQLDCSHLCVVREAQHRCCAIESSHDHSAVSQDQAVLTS